MSVLAFDVVADAAELVGDPNFTRIGIDKWLLYFNRRCRMAATRMRLVKWLASFDIQQDEELYAMPDDSGQVSRIQYSPSPENPRTFRDVKELQEDEARVGTDWNYPTGEPIKYRADQGFFYLIPRPTVFVAGGGRIEYWGLPDKVTDLSLQNMPFHDRLRDLIAEGMICDALRKLEKESQADRAEARWADVIEHNRRQLEDRSADRRSRIRLASAHRGNIGQI